MKEYGVIKNNIIKQNIHPNQFILVNALKSEGKYTINESNGDANSKKNSNNTVVVMLINPYKTIKNMLI